MTRFWKPSERIAIVEQALANVLSVEELAAANKLLQHDEFLHNREFPVVKFSSRLQRQLALDSVTSQRVLGALVRRMTETS